MSRLINFDTSLIIIILLSSNTYFLILLINSNHRFIEYRINKPLISLKYQITIRDTSPKRKYLIIDCIMNNSQVKIGFLLC